MNNLNIDKTIDFVKNIVDNNRCPICDKKDGQRLRYPCGHTTCDNCVIDREECEICPTLPRVSMQPKLDNASTQRAENSSRLLKACEELLHTDVYRRIRLSEQLRIEKELFPQCIQAPVTYENKRKSLVYSSKNKENKRKSHFPGEKTSSLKDNMENSVSYVQQWLTKNEKDLTRKPFANLNVNTTVNPNIRNKIKPFENKDENETSFKTPTKRSHYKTTVKNNSTLDIKTKVTTRSGNNFKRIKRELHDKNNQSVAKQKKTDHDESGIFLDNDATIVIDDSQETIIDKDKKAWLAVLKASENEDIKPNSVINLDNTPVISLKLTDKQVPIHTSTLQYKDDRTSKVPFYKKCFITEPCKDCDVTVSITVEKPKEVKITINEEKFIATINILRNVEPSSKNNRNNSVSIQTDVSEAINIRDAEKICTDINFTKNGDAEDSGVYDSLQKSVSIGDSSSEDLFNEGKTAKDESIRVTTNGGIVIAESDSDTDMDESGPLSVKVDVHRSCDESEYGILGELVSMQEHENRARRGPRGLTPTSTDSSDKENFDPNRKKRNLSKKKKKMQRNDINWII